MARFSYSDSKRVDSLWPDPIGKCDIVSTNGTKLKFEFSLGLPLVQLLAEGIDEFSFSISPSRSQNGYRYFSGDTESIEDDINEFFNAQASIKNQKSLEYDSYYYKKYSLSNFISDGLLSKINSEKSKIEIRDYGQRPTSATVKELTSLVPNTGNYLVLSNNFEPTIDLNLFPQIDCPNSAQEYFRENCGIYSSSIIDLGKVKYPRNINNKSILGELSHTGQKYISINDPRQLSSFWSLWKKMFSWQIGDPERLPEFMTYREKYFPCKIKFEIDFGSHSSAQKLLLGLVSKDNLEIAIDFYGELKKSLVHKSIKKPFSLVEMIKNYSADVLPPVVKVSPTGDTDRVYFSNPNSCSLQCQIVQAVWDDQTGELVHKSNEKTIVVPAKSESCINFPTTSESRFYDGTSMLGFWSDFLHLNSDSDSHNKLPTEQIPWKSWSATVPGVYKIISPTKSDPGMLIYVSEEEGAQIVLSKVPPYIDQIKFYYRSVKTSGYASKPSPGSNRQNWTVLDVSPTYSYGDPARTSTIDTRVMFPGKYQVLCDLYRKGCTIDTLSTFFTLEPQNDAAKHGVDFDIRVDPSVSSQLASVITIKESKINVLGVDVINEMIENGTLPQPLNEPFDESWPTSKKTTSYLIERHNLLNSTVEQLGTIQAGSKLDGFPTALTTKTHVYTAKQYVADIGQLISTIMPKTVSENQGIEYLYDYAKFKSQKYIKNQVLPAMTYQLDGPTSWPDIALKASSSGIIKSHKVVRNFNITPEVRNMGVVYDEFRKINLISWNTAWSYNEDYIELINFPKYWIITGKYGGVTSIVSCTISPKDSKRNWCVPDKTLAGALGTVNYMVFCVYPDGTISSQLASSAISHADDKKMRLTLGRGL